VTHKTTTPRNPPCLNDKLTLLFELHPAWHIRSHFQFKRFPHSQWGVGSHCVPYVQIARCNNYQMKILGLFEFPHVLTA